MGCIIHKDLPLPQCETKIQNNKIIISESVINFLTDADLHNMKKQEEKRLRAYFTKQMEAGMKEMTNTIISELIGSGNVDEVANRISKVNKEKLQEQIKVIEEFQNQIKEEVIKKVLHAAFQLIGDTP